MGCVTYHGGGLRLNAPNRLIAVSLLLGAAGFLGNWCRIELFFNLDFLFGSFFVMLAIARCGVAGGVVAGLLAGSCSYLIWHHPWSMIVFAGEALFVALLDRRWPGQLVLLDTVYWFFLGMPQLWVFYHRVMGVSPQATLLVALKQSLNGIFNALLATIFIYALQLLRPAGSDGKNLIPFRQLVFVGMVSVVLVPAFLYLLVDLKELAAREENDSCRRILSISETAQCLLNAFIDDNHQAVIALSKLVGDPAATPFAQMQDRVETIKQGVPALFRMWVLNGDSVTVAYAPPVDSRGKSSLGIDFSDRPYIPTLRKTLKPMLGDVVMGKTGAPMPVLPLLAPIVVRGSYRGFCGGTVDFGRLSSQLRTLVKNSLSEITVLDRTGKVVVSSSGRWRSMQKFARPGPGEIGRLAGGVYHWIPAEPGKRDAFTRWSEALLVKETGLSAETPWTIVVESPLRPHLDILWRKSIDEFLLLWGMILLIFAVSHLLSNCFVASLQSLAAISEDLPRSGPGGAKLSWPETRISELFSVVGNFRSMASALGDYIGRLEELKGELEKRVEARTVELRKSEERYGRIIETANEGILVVDDRATITFANRQFLKMTGYRRDEVLGRDFAHFMPVEEFADHARRLKTRKEGKAEQYEVRICSKNGSLITLQLSATPIFDEEHRFQGSFGMCTDITASKRIKDELADLNRALEERVTRRTADLQRLNGELASFCYSISHELRAPIARLLGFSGMLLETAGSTGPEELSFVAKRIGVASLKLRSVIDSLLLMNRLSRAEIRLEPVNLSELADEKLRELLEELPGRKIEATIAPALMVRGDRNMLSVCMQQLLGNAVKYTSREAAARVELDLQMLAGERVFFLRDNGAGFNPSFAEKLFEPFCRLHSDDEFEGSGMGLPTVQRIVERHGGRIWAESQEGRGATFYFTLEQKAASAPPPPG